MNPDADMAPFKVTTLRGGSVAERILRIIEGSCPECALRIVLRERGRGFDEGAADTEPRCLRGPDPFQCQNYREVLTELHQFARR
jgi:hypothetical protein